MVTLKDVGAVPAVDRWSVMRLGAVNVGPFNPAMIMTVLSLLGLTVEELLAWRPDLIVHDDPSEIQVGDTSAYVSHPDGEFEFVCNGNGVVDTVFVFRPSPVLDGMIGFGTSRKNILAQLGVPRASGQERIDRYLGPQGAWDRFDYPEWSMHFQYTVGGDRVERITVRTRKAMERKGHAAAG